VFHSLIAESTPRDSLCAIALDNKRVASPIVRTQNTYLQQRQYQQAYPQFNQQQSPASRKYQQLIG
jgi:hypothetical protein